MRLWTSTPLLLPTAVSTLLYQHRSSEHTCPLICNNCVAPWRSLTAWPGAYFQNKENQVGLQAAHRKCFITVLHPGLCASAQASFDARHRVMTPCLPFSLDTSRSCEEEQHKRDSCSDGAEDRRETEGSRSVGLAVSVCSFVLTVHGSVLHSHCIAATLNHHSRHVPALSFSALFYAHTGTPKGSTPASVQHPPDQALAQMRGPC